jgi:DNA segregation ATPase FtsK/SpoIIIE-like protein
MKDKKGKTVRIDFSNESNNNENNFIISPSGTGRSFVGEAQELLDQDGYLLTSSLQRKLKVDYKTAAEVMKILKELGVITKSPDNHKYIRTK